MPLERSDGQRWIGPENVGDALEEIIDSGRDARPRPVDDRKESVTDGETQPWLGHSVSETTLTMTPAMAAARPLRSESFEMTREKKDAVGSDMVRSLLEEHILEPSRVLMPSALRFLRAPLQAGVESERPPWEHPGGRRVRAGGDPTEHVARRVAVVGQRGDVLLDGSADPRRADAVDGGRTNPA
jgi:hypothetical protein